MTLHQTAVPDLQVLGLKSVATMFNPSLAWGFPCVLQTANLRLESIS